MPYISRYWLTVLSGLIVLPILLGELVISYYLMMPNYHMMNSDNKN